MSIFSLIPWILSSIIVSVIFFMIIGMMIEEKNAIAALIIICGLTFGSILNMGIDHNSQMYNREIAIESHIICLKAEKIHIINQLESIKKIQIANKSTHLEYTQYHIDELKETNEFLLSTNIEASKEAIEYINNNPWLLK